MKLLKKEEKEKNNQNNIEKTLKVKNQKYPKFNYLTNLNEYKLFNLNWFYHIFIGIILNSISMIYKRQSCF